MTPKRLAGWLIVLCATTGQFLFSRSTPDLSQVHRVLIINEANPSYPAIRMIDDAIQESFRGSKYRIEIYREYLDTMLFPDGADQNRFWDFYVRKYQQRKPDVIVTVGSSPLKLLATQHNRLFPGVPVIFCFPNGVEHELKSDAQITGVTMGLDAVGTVNAALQLLPETKHVIVVGGAASFDHQQIANVRRQLEMLKGRLDISYLTDLSITEIEARVASLSKGSIVLYSSIARDAEGNLFTSQESGPLICRASAVPVFSLYDVFIGHGEVGGNLARLREQGTVAGKDVLKIFDGLRPSDIAIEQAPNGFVFDWRALKRWGLKESELPPGTTLLYRQPTAWESYRGYIIAGVVLILLQTTLISALLWQRNRRRKFERDLSLMNDRLRLSFEVSKSVGWNWDLKNRRNRWFGDLQSIFGLAADRYEAKLGEFMEYVHPDDRRRVAVTIARARASRETYSDEYRVLQRDGHVRWIAARGAFYYSEAGVPERMVGMAMDITERKAAEEALTTLSGRLIKAEEEERSRIAREIHDDYQQRLALFANDLDSLREQIETSAPAAKETLRQLWNEVSELAADMHSLSHRLHSSTLENLGLVAGIKAFCHEFEQQQGLEVRFTSEEVPRSIPPETALCFFRVAQEALRNVKRHSGADRAEVHLEWTGDSLHLVVSDSGRGFERTVRSASSGIGIRSMEERLRLVGGHLNLHSQPSQGTRIDAWVPLKAVSQTANFEVNVTPLRD